MRLIAIILILSGCATKTPGYSNVINGKRIVAYYPKTYAINAGPIRLGINVWPKAVLK